MPHHRTPVLRPLHVAVIPDGNGRWAVSRGRPRTEGHRAGVEAVDRVVAAAPGLGIGTLTLFAFSAANWKRPGAEVRGLLRILEEYLAARRGTWAAAGTRVSVVGRRDRLPGTLRAAVEAAEVATAAGSGLHLRLGMDYSAREAILRAACRMYTAREVSEEAFSKLLGGASQTSQASPEVDLVIRTGGEQRLSDFLLWESAFAELYFTSRPWPDFGAADLEAAVAEYHRRERRFGRLPEAAAG